MKKWIIYILLLVLAVHCLGRKKNILFPKREYVKKHSRLFFKEVNLTFPDIFRVEFFVKSETFPSAYIHLTEFTTKNKTMQEILPQFKDKNRDLISRFNDEYKAKLKIENYRDIMVEMNVDRLKFLLTVMSVLYHDYLGNKLSGTNAFKLWNIALNVIRETVKDKKKNIQNAAILSFATHLVFFKNTKKWQKRSRKILKKLSSETVSGKNNVTENVQDGVQDDVQLIMKKK